MNRANVQGKNRCSIDFVTIFSTFSPNFINFPLSSIQIHSHSLKWRKTRNMGRLVFSMESKEYIYWNKESSNINRVHLTEICTMVIQWKENANILIMSFFLIPKGIPVKSKKKNMKKKINHNQNFLIKWSRKKMEFTVYI